MLAGQGVVLAGQGVVLAGQGVVLAWQTVFLPLAFAGQVVVLDEQGLDVLPQHVVVLGRPVAQDAGGELVLRVARPAQDHLHHLLTGSRGRGRKEGEESRGGKEGMPGDRWGAFEKR